MLLGDLNRDMRNTPAINLNLMPSIPHNYQWTYQVQPQIRKHGHPHRYHLNQLALQIHCLHSDHCPIACIRNGSAVKRPPLITLKRSLKHFSEQAFPIDLARVSWKDIDLILSVEYTWLFFKSVFPTILNKDAPFNKFRTRNRYSLWFTLDLTALDQHQNILWHTALASNSPRDIQLFREVRNQYTQAVRKAKDSFFKQKFASCTTN
jgi:hypothetical protein